MRTSHFCVYQVKSAYESSELIRAVLIWGLSGIERQGVFPIPTRWDTNPLQGYPSIKLADPYSYTWVERGTVRVELRSCSRTQCHSILILSLETSTLTREHQVSTLCLLVLTKENEAVVIELIPHIDLISKVIFRSISASVSQEGLEIQPVTRSLLM